MAKTDINDILALLLGGRGIPCDCDHCKRSAAIKEIAAKLPDEDAQRLLSIYDSIIDDEEERDIQLAHLEEENRVLGLRLEIIRTIA